MLDINKNSDNSLSSAVNSDIKLDSGVSESLNLPNIQLGESGISDIQLVDNSGVAKGCLFTFLGLLLTGGLVLVPILHPLESALKHRHFTYARVLMTFGADINHRDSNGHSYLYNALMNRNYTCARFLLDCSDIDKSEFTPLGLAVMMDNVSEVESLLKDGESPTKKDSYGKIPLQWAIEMNHHECVEALLEHDDAALSDPAGNILYMLKLAEDGHEACAFAIKTKARKAITQSQFMSVNEAYEQGDARAMILYAAAGNNSADHLLSVFERAALAGDVAELKKLLDSEGDYSIRRNLSAAVYWASAAGNVNALKLLLTQANEMGKDLDYKLCPLMAAVRNGHVDVVNHLLNSPRFNRGYKDKKGRNAVYVAAEQGNAEMLELLLLSPLNDNESVDYSGITPLQLAVDHKHEACAEMLRKMGYKEGLTAQQAAYVLNEKNITIATFVRDADSIQEEHVQLAIKAGMNFNASYGSYGYNPLTSAVAKDNRRMFKLLLGIPSVDVNHKDNEGRTALTLAVSNGSKYMVKELLEHKSIDVNKPNGDQMSPLEIALEKKNEDITKMLLNAKGINVKSNSNKNGKSSLDRALESGNLEAADKLLAMGENINNRGSAGDGYVHRYLNNEKVLKFLIQKGANVNLTNSNERTPLHLAIQAGNKKAFDQLMAVKGIDVNKQALDGKTALLMALESNSRYRDDFVNKLLEKNEIDVMLSDNRGENSLTYAVSHGDKRLLSNLLKRKGADVNYADGEGNTLLHTAVGRGDEDCMKVLMDTKGIQLDVGNKAGITPLMVAAQNGYQRFVKMLSNSTSIDMNKADSSGRTALYHAAEKGQTSVVTTLLEDRRVDYDKPDTKGVTPRSIAQKKEHYDCVKAFRNYIDKVPSNYEAQIETYRKEAAENKSSSQFLLALCYYEGKGTAKNLDEACKWFSKAANLNHSYAQYYLGLCYQNGHGVRKNESEAIKWFQKAAEQDQTDAQYMMGMAYLEGKGVGLDRTKAVQWFKKAAQAGCEESQFRLGYCYENGYGVYYDSQEAYSWYKKASDQGHIKATYNVGCHHYKNKNYDMAFVCFVKASEKRLPEAQFNLGDCFYNGYGTLQDRTKAFELYKAAAEQGYAPAQYNVACCYYEGTGVKENEKEAMKWFKKAAQQGHKAAKEFLEN